MDKSSVGNKGLLQPVYTEEVSFSFFFSFLSIGLNTLEELHLYEIVYLWNYFTKVS